MNIPPKYEDVVANLDAALAREAALREELDRHKSLYNQLEKALSRVHCMYGKRLLDLIGERQNVLVPDEEFVKYFEELKCLKLENSALQQRLTVAEQRLSQVDGACDLAMRAIDDDERGANFVKIIQAIKDKAALKPAAEVEALGARPVGCCCPPKGHTGIWAAAMCPVHFGLKRPGIKP